MVPQSTHHDERPAVDITPQEVAETLSMVSEQNLDLRTITMGISLAGCADEDMGRMCDKVYDRITRTAEHLVETADDLQAEYGIPIANKRVSVTPIAQIAAGCPDEDLSPLAHAMDRAAETLGIDFMGGFSALVQKGMGNADRRLIASVPEALATTDRVCSSLNIASTRAGINMDAVLLSAETILECARRTVDIDCYGAAKFVVFANMVEDSPFMAGAVHGSGEADAVINVGVSGPGVMAAALAELPESANLMDVAEKIKQTAFKITRAGELMSREASRRLGVEKGIVDLSLAPTPAAGDSVAMMVPGQMPTYAGAKRDAVNPTSAIMSCAMLMFNQGMTEEAGAIVSALEATYAAGELTSEFGGSLTASEFTDRVVSRI